MHPLITMRNSKRKPSNLQLKVIKLFSFPLPFIKLSHKHLLCIFKCFVPNKGNRNSRRRLRVMVFPSFWEDYYMFIYTHFWELMISMGSHGSLSLLFVMKVMVCHFVSNIHEVMIAFIVVLHLIIVVEISLQLHQAFSSVLCIFCSPILKFQSLSSNAVYWTNHSLLFLPYMIPCFYLCICFFHFSTLTISLWSCLSSFINVMTWISTFVSFSVASSCLFLSPFKHLFYFHLFLSPCLSMFLCISLSSTLSPSIFIFLPMSICLF